MSKQDSNGVRTPQDIERKYNFSKMLGLTKNYEIMEKGLTKIENELTDMLNAFMINLKDVLDNQSEISLWFYYGIPSLENEPYISWSNIDEHNGDIYYDKNTGYVYQFKKIEGKYLWELNVNPDLIEAMALTNSEIDTVDDHERKIFFSTPYTPYVNGDWWIKEDGSLYICQLSKPVDEEYEEQDFIISSSYINTVSEKIGDTIKVLKGTVTKISDNFVQFTDLATGGSTTIAGENIKTGKIISNNYMEGAGGKTISGTKLNLSDGIIKTKNISIGDDLLLTSGTRILGDNGLLTTKIIDANIFSSQFIGGTAQLPLSAEEGWLEFDFEIPNDFSVQSAYIVLDHSPARIYTENGTTTGRTREAKLYYSNNPINDKLFTSYYGQLKYENQTLTEIPGIFGTNGFTGNISNGQRLNTLIDVATPIDLKPYIKKGFNRWLIKCAYSGVNDTGCLKATLMINGYTNFS